MGKLVGYCSQSLGVLRSLTAFAHGTGLTRDCRRAVRRLMREHGLRSAWKRKFVHTTGSKHAQAISPNVLNRQFNPTQANQAWVADITYIRTRSGWLYLAVVLDLFARKVVGWAMAADMQAGGWYAVRCSWPSCNASQHRA